MKDFLDKKLFFASVVIHFLVFVLIGFSYRDSHIKKTFLAYGRHSKRQTNAYFRSPSAPKKLDYGKYLKARRGRPKKKAKPRRSAKKSVMKKAKSAPKKTAVKKKSVPKKKLIKKKNIAQKKPKDRKLLRSEKVKNIKTPEKNAKPVSKEKDSQPMEVLHFNLMGELDPKVIRYQQCIQYEVDRVWKPPLGVPKGTECIVTFVIDEDGSVKSFNIDKKSKILIYDLSIVRVSKDFRFDKCLWGKSFVVNFRQ